MFKQIIDIDDVPHLLNIDKIEDIVFIKEVSKGGITGSSIFVILMDSGRKIRTYDITPITIRLQKTFPK